MKNFKSIFAAIAAVVVFASCEKTVLGPTVVISNVPSGRYSTYTVPQNESGEFGIVFGGYNAATLATKASVISTSGTGYDSFKLFAWNSNGLEVMNPYTVEATGANAYDYSQVSGQELKYFSNAADSYDFIGVIPQTKTATLSNGTVTVEDVVAFTADDERVSGTLTSDSDEEFLYSYKNVVKASYASPVVLPFEHGNALLYLAFTSDRADTELIDYTPYTPGTPATQGTPAWDEDVTVTTFSTTAKPFPSIGPLVEDITISDADITYINAKYSCTYGTNEYTGNASWPTYFASNGTFAGDLDDNVWDYLTTNYPALTTISIGNWGSSVSNTNMRLVHIDTTPDTSNGGKLAYRAWFVNVQNVDFNNPTTTTVTVHHDAVPGTPEIPATGLKGIRVFSVDNTASPVVHAAHTVEADATISATGLEFTNRTTEESVIEFSLPSTTTVGTGVYSPTTFYAIPGDAGVTAFVTKLSYIYNGVTVYDVRVPLTLPAGGLVAGKYYKYTINITSTGNGTNDPTQAETDKDEVDIVTNPVISVQFNETGYTEGTDQVVNI